MKIFGGDSKGKKELEGTSCDCPKPVSDCQSTDAIRAMLCAIQRVINEMGTTGFSIEVLITTQNGVVYTVSFVCGTRYGVKVTDTFLKTSDGVIALNSITKIRIKSGEVSNQKFGRKLFAELDDIMNGRSCGSFSRDASYAQCIQRFINQNKLDVDTISYNGGMETIESVKSATDIHKTNVVGSVTLQTTDEDVVQNVAISAPKTSVAGTVTVADQQVVTDVTKNSRTVVTDVAVQKLQVSPPVTTTNVNVLGEVETEDQMLVTNVEERKTTVSAPVTVQQKQVVTDVETIPDADYVTDIGSTPVTFKAVNLQETGGAVTGVGRYGTHNGMIQGITAITTARTQKCNICHFSVVDEDPDNPVRGEMQIVIPAGRFGNNIPPEDVTLPITIEGGTDANTVTLDSREDCYVLGEETRLLTGITGNPAIVNLTIPEMYTTQQFVRNVSTTEVTAAGPVNPTTETGRLVANVTEENINTPVLSTPSTVSVVEDTVVSREQSKIITAAEQVVIRNINPSEPIVVNSVTESVMEEFDEVGIVTKEVAADIVTVTNKQVVESVTPDVTHVDIKNTVGINPVQKSVVEDVDVSTISVKAPAKESIDGEVVSAGSGIVAVDNEDGDISLYNTCDINTVGVKNT